jgi:hypothetical protein
VLLWKKINHGLGTAVQCLRSGKAWKKEWKKQNIFAEVSGRRDLRNCCYIQPYPHCYLIWEMPVQITGDFVPLTGRLELKACTIYVHAVRHEYVRLSYFTVDRELTGRWGWRACCRRTTRPGGWAPQCRATRSSPDSHPTGECRGAERIITSLGCPKIQYLLC